jgi:hypothetical protein
MSIAAKRMKVHEKYLTSIKTELTGNLFLVSIT